MSPVALRETQADRVALAYSGLSQQLAFSFWMRGNRFFDCDVSIVAGVAFDEDQFCAFAHLRSACEDI